MLDKRSFSLLTKINHLCPNGKYAIVEEKDLSEGFSVGETDRETLKQAISFLTTEQFVNVKYAERGVYCLCVSPLGLSCLERAKDDGRERTKRWILPCAFAFLGGFLGGLIGILSVALVRGRLC